MFRLENEKGLKCLSFLNIRRFQCVKTIQKMIYDAMYVTKLNVITAFKVYLQNQINVKECISGL